MTNDENKIDVELREIDSQLRRTLRAPEPPEGLEERVFNASVGGLRGGVIGRIDRATYGGWWRYAVAAVLLVGLYVMRTPPEQTTVVEPTGLADAQVVEMEEAIAGAVGPVDERIDALASEIEELGMLDFGDENDLAEELMQIESEMF